MNSPLLDKSLDFATQIVLFYEEFSKSKKDTTIAKQLLRSATSVGANINIVFRYDTEIYYRSSDGSEVLLWKLE